MLKKAVVILLSPTSVLFSKPCLGHQVHSLSISAIPDTVHYQQLPCPPLAPFPGEDSWLCNISSVNFGLISRNLHLFSPSVPYTCGYRFLQFSLGCWAISYAVVTPLRNKCTQISPILKNFSINFSLPFRGGLSPFVEWRERPSSCWGPSLLMTQIYMTVGLVSLSSSQILGVKGHIVLQSRGPIATLSKRLVDNHCFQIASLLFTF